MSGAIIKEQGINEYIVHSLVQCDDLCLHPLNFVIGFYMLLASLTLCFEVKIPVCMVIIYTYILNTAFFLHTLLVLVIVIASLGDAETRTTPFSSLFYKATKTGVRVSVML